MYSKIKSCITQGKEFSDFFVCEVGVRQGENLQTLSVFIVFKKHLNDNNVQSLNLIDNFCIENITTYLLYAGDVLLISEFANGLQNALNAFNLYWKQWKLKVNTQKKLK